MRLQWKRYNAVILGPTRFGCKIRGSYIMDVHYYVIENVSRDL